MVSRNLHFRPKDPGLTCCSLQSWLHPLPYPADWSVIDGVFMREFVNVVIWWWEKEWFNILQIYSAICAMHVRLPDLSGRGILDGDHMNISLFFSNSHRLNSLKEGSIFLYCVPPLFSSKKMRWSSLPLHWSTVFGRMHHWNCVKWSVMVQGPLLWLHPSYLGVCFKRAQSEITWKYHFGGRKSQIFGGMPFVGEGKDTQAFRKLVCRKRLSKRIRTLGKELRLQGPFVQVRHFDVACEYISMYSCYRTDHFFKH